MAKQDESKMNKVASGNSLSFLEQLLIDLHQYIIAQYLELEDLLRLSSVSRTMFFKYCDRLAKTRLSHAVKGEEAEALKMIDANPRLLLTLSKAADYSACSCKGFTSVQAALLCHDVTGFGA